MSAFEVTGEGGRRSRFEASRSGRGELAGRDTELSLLHERWESVRSGEGEAILLLGEAGIGKSRISHALVRDAAYESLLNSRRRDIHRSIADVLEQGSGGVNHELVGMHAAEAGQVERACESFQKVLDHPQWWSDAASRVVHGESPEVIAMTYQAWIACLQGRVDSGLVLVENAVTQAQTIGVPIASVFAKCIVQIVLAFRRDVTNCAQGAKHMMHITDEH